MNPVCYKKELNLEGAVGNSENIWKKKVPVNSTDTAISKNASGALKLEIEPIKKKHVMELTWKKARQV